MLQSVTMKTLKGSYLFIQESGILALIFQNSLLGFECPQKCIGWKFNPQIHILIVFRGGALGKWFDETVKGEALMMALVAL